MSFEYEQDPLNPKVWHLMEQGELQASFHEKITGSPSSFPLFETKKEFFLFEYQKALLYCYRRLSCKSFYSKQLLKELKTYFISNQSANKVLIELHSLGYLNDQEWVKRFIQKKKGQKIGQRKIETLLYQMGVDPSFFIPLLQEEMQEGNQEVIQALIEKKYSHLNLKEPKQKNKVIQALLRRGYLLEELSFLF